VFCRWSTPPSYSVRRATTGSIAEARRAGRNPANNATKRRRRATPVIVGRSFVEIPKSMLAMHRVATSEEGIPMAMPNTVNTSATIFSFSGVDEWRPSPPYQVTGLREDKDARTVIRSMEARYDHGDLGFVIVTGQVTSTLLSSQVRA